MKRLTLMVLAAAAAALTVPAAAQRRPSPGSLPVRATSLRGGSLVFAPPTRWPGPASVTRTRRPGIPRGIGAPFWLDPDTFVLPRVERFVSATTESVVPDEAIVRVRPGASIAAFAARYGLSIHRSLGLSGTFVVRADPSRRLTQSLAALAADPSLQYVEANRRVRIAAVPNDPRFTEQWGLDLAAMPSGWDLQKGTLDSYNAGVTVGVIDTGVSPSHPDLRGRVATGGKNFLTGSANTADDNGHGTHIAGTIAAATNNAVGVAGGTWEGVRVLPLKAFDANGYADIAVLAESLKYAGDLGLKVVNMSAGTPDDSPTTRNAVTYFLSRPQRPVLVAASGNDSIRYEQPPIINKPLYPARYSDARIIGVAGVGRQGEVAWYSNGGPGVDIAAPGGNSDYDGDTANMILNIAWSPQRGDTYAYLEGTSMAAPHVSAAVALLLSEGLRTDDVEKVLYRSVTGANGSRNDNLGYGVLNTNAALRSLLATVELKWPTSRYPVETTSTSILGNLVNASSNGVGVAVDGRAATASIQSTSGSLLLTSRVPVAAGPHTVTISAPGALTGRPRTSSFSFTVRPKVLKSGWHMFSLPYAPAPSTPSPGSVFSGRAFKLARWVPTTQEYAVIDAATGRNDTRASFAPPSTGVASNPVGLGYWVYLPQDTPLTLTADPVLTTPYRVPITVGWNQVGDPFVFPVRLSDAQFQTGSTTVSVAVALSNGWLRPSAFQLGDPRAENPYNKLAAGDVVLQPWTSTWLRSIVPGTLIIPNKPAP